MKDKICPVCNEGHLHSKSESVEFEYKSVKKNLNTKYSICDECESEIASEEDAKFNKRAVTAFHKEVDGLLTGSELKAIRNKLGITQQQASVIFGGGPNSFTKYESDDVIQSAAMDSIIRLAIESVDAFDILCRKRGIDSTKSKSLGAIFITEPINIVSKLTSVAQSNWVSVGFTGDQSRYFSPYECH
ncbi:TPA: type II toxin-antitoxin system MqsA family antitoxin [Providencia alcalifaciens]